VRTGNDTLCVDRRIGSYPIQVLSIEVGARRPLGVSSAGVAILAAMPTPETQDRGRK
jgi:DNA-binding IclR family transcriptional regulator